jgi:hypothetical protein
MSVLSASQAPALVEMLSREALDQSAPQLHQTLALHVLGALVWNRGGDEKQVCQWSQQCRSCLQVHSNCHATEMSWLCDGCPILIYHGCCIHWNGIAGHNRCPSFVQQQCTADTASAVEHSASSCEFQQHLKMQIIISSSMYV